MNAKQIEGLNRRIQEVNEEMARADSSINRSALALGYKRVFPNEPLLLMNPQSLLECRVYALYGFIECARGEESPIKDATTEELDKSNADLALINKGHEAFSAGMAKLEKFRELIKAHEEKIRKHERQTDKSLN